MATKKIRKPKTSNINFDGKNIPKEVVDMLLEGNSGGDLMGPNGLMRQLSGALISRVMEAELTHELDYESGETPSETQGNRRNGFREKTLKTELGDVNIKVPRDRDGTFEPKIVPKHQRRFEEFDAKILSMYALGMSTRDISKHLEEIYGVDVSKDLITQVTNAILPDLEKWRTKPLEEVYTVVWIDALRVGTRETGRVEKRAVYLVMGMNAAGERSVLGMWIQKNEGAKFWLGILGSLKARGVKDIFFLCADGLKGMPEAVQATFPASLFQTCVVHLIRMSVAMIPWKIRKEACRDLKKIYTAVDVTQAESELCAFEEAWKDYPFIADAWRARFDEWTPFLDYPQEIRKVVYTTNAIEALNRQVRKVIKTSGAFPTDQAAEKLIFMAIQNAEKSWSKRVTSRKTQYHQFKILFGERMPNYVDVFDI